MPDSLSAHGARQLVFEPADPAIIARFVQAVRAAVEVGRFVPAYAALLDRAVVLARHDFVLGGSQRS